MLQAVLQAETINNVKRVFGTLCEAWANEQKQAPPLTDLVRQVHKDYADAIERARAEIFPQSRAVNDFFHLREKEKTVHAKCKGLVLQKGKCVKEHFDWIMYTLTNIRFAPRPDAFSHLWQGFLSRLIAQGEHEVAKYMYKEVSCIMHGEALALPDGPWPIALEATGQYFFAPHWSGLWVVRAGTACGNQPTEAMHSSWQRKLDSQKIFPSVNTIFDVMQATYRTWEKTYDWPDETVLSSRPQVLEQRLLNGRVLVRVDRSPAVDFHMATCKGNSLVSVRDHAHRALSWWRRTPRQASTCWRRFRRR